MGVWSPTQIIGSVWGEIAPNYIWNIFPWCQSSLSLASYGYFHQPLMIQVASQASQTSHIKKVSHKHDRKSSRFFFRCTSPGIVPNWKRRFVERANRAIWCNNKSNESLCRCGRADHSFAFRNFVSSYGTIFPQSAVLLRESQSTALVRYGESSWCYVFSPQLVCQKCRTWMYCLGCGPSPVRKWGWNNPSETQKKRPFIGAYFTLFITGSGTNLDSMIAR